MKKLIIWVQCENKKITDSQFHTEAENTLDAIENLKKSSTEKFKVIGVQNYPENHNHSFEKNKFYK